MHKVAVISSKGGAGKTTCSLHLAVEAQKRGFTSVILDLDPQSSASEWADHRENQPPTVTSIQVGRLKKAIQVAETANVDYLVIDSAPHSADATLTICEVADLVIVPCRPGILDLRAIGTTSRIVKGVNRQAHVVLNCMPVRSPLVEADARDAAKAQGLLVAPLVLHQRSAFAKSLIFGMTAQEYEPAGKASEEIAALYEWTISQLSGKPDS